MATTHFRSCPLCEATCGLAIEVDGDRVISVRGDDDDPFSRGYVCPKGAALADLHADPDRLRRPVRRAGDRWEELGWDEALDLVATRLRETRATHGADAIAVYQGNPTAHNLGLMTFGQLALRTLGTKNMYSATSLDQLPHMLAALTMFGNQFLMPVPDVDRADLFICLGANPLASNGSLMTAPDMRGRLRAIQGRGGRVIVLDPRRTETAERADRHLFIRPGADAALLLAMIHVIFAEGLARPTRPAAGEDALRRAAAAWTPERAAAITGVAPDDVRELARALATTPRAVLYGRVGVCTQEFGGLAAWLCYAINALTGHLDEPGGLMFTTPAVDPVPLSRPLGLEGGFARWRSRVSGKPEFGGEYPMAAFAEEIETPGPGQIRALVTSAGNPVLSAPGGPRLERALAGLDFMVSIDPYINETTRLAHVILPPASALERADYDAALAAFSVRNVAKWSPAVFPRPADARHDWEICLGLWTRLRVPSVGRRLAERALARLGPAARRAARRAEGPGGALARQAAARAARPGPRPARAALARPARHAGPARAPRAGRVPRGSGAARVRRAPAGARDDRTAAAPFEQLVDAQQRAAREGQAALHGADASRRRRGARAGRRRHGPRRVGDGCDRAARRGDGRDDARRGQRAARLGPRARRRATARRVARARREHQRRDRSGAGRRADGHERAERSARRGGARMTERGPALFAKIGEAKLRAVLTDFYARIFDDVMIGFLFAGKDRQHLIDREYEFTARLLGSDVPYRGRPMREAHAKSPIFGGHFERRMQLLRETLRDHAVDDDVQRVWIDHAFALRAQITPDRGSECKDTTVGPMSGDDPLARGAADPEAPVRLGRRR